MLRSTSEKPDPPSGNGAVWEAGQFRRAALILSSSAIVMLTLAYLQKAPCRFGGGWLDGAAQFRKGCYSDVFPLYWAEGLAEGLRPYLEHKVEYPVLTGAAMYLASWLVNAVSDREIVRGYAFFDATAVGIAVCAVIGIVATGYAAGPRHWKQALRFALAPALFFTAYINWDLLAVSFSALAFAFWARQRPGLSGICIGLAISAKFYPICILAAITLLCTQAVRWRALAALWLGALCAWFVVNLPVMLTGFDGWVEFYRFSRGRPADWGSVFYVFQCLQLPYLGTTDIGQINLLGMFSFAALLLAIAAFVYSLPQEPRADQVAFLVLSAFLSTNKVWSPQFVLWLLPLAVLARPKGWSWLIWQLSEVIYFWAIWYYLLAGVNAAPPHDHHPADSWYLPAVVFRALAVILMAGCVLRDMACAPNVANRGRSQSQRLSAKA